MDLPLASELLVPAKVLGIGGLVMLGTAGLVAAGFYGIDKRLQRAERLIEALQVEVQEGHVIPLPAGIKENHAINPAVTAVLRGTEYEVQPDYQSGKLWVELNILGKYGFGAVGDAGTVITGYDLKGAGIEVDEHLARRKSSFRPYNRWVFISLEGLQGILDSGVKVKHRVAAQEWVTEMKRLEESHFSFMLSDPVKEQGSAEGKQWTV